MKIAILCTGFSTDPNSPSLTDELANAFVYNGHEVEVFSVNWSKNSTIPPKNGTEQNKLHLNSVNAIEPRFGPKIFKKVFKWLFSSLGLLRPIAHFRIHNRADLIIGFSPASSMLLPILLMTVCSRSRSFLIQWDFFPIHHAEIGLLKGKTIVRALKAIENQLIRRFDIIGCMSPKNADYLRANYRLAKDQRIVQLPIWSSFPSVVRLDRNELRRQHRLPIDRPLLIFGGQMSKGRGIEDILVAAHRSAQSGFRYGFVFVGNGEQVPLIKSAIHHGAENVHHLGGMSRSAYLSLLTACDVGIVCTVRDVSVPTFPSKTLDYINAGIPIIAAVEQATDFGKFIQEAGIGLSIEAGETEQFLSAIAKILETNSSAPWNVAETYLNAKKIFSVNHVAQSLVDYLHTDS